jgi:ketosteroid isomerase-like protein
MNHEHDPAAEISAAMARFLERFAANDVKGIAACYTEDAQMLAANMEAIRGRAAIEAVFKFTGAPGHTLEFETLELEVHGATAVALGRYVRRRGDGSTFDRGKYVTILKRAADGWKIHRDMFNSSLPRTAAASAQAVLRAAEAPRRAREI